MIEHTYTFRAGISCVLASASVAVLLPAKEKLTGLTPPQAGLLRALNAGTSPELDDPGAQELLERLCAGGRVCVTVSWDGLRRYTITPFSTPPTARPTASETQPLSRFAVLRAGAGDPVLEHPLSWCDLVIHDGQTAAAVTGLAPVPGRLAADLSWGGFTANEAETAGLAARAWGTHELWFHRRSTLGARVNSFANFGPTRWAAGKFPPAPARRPEFTGTPVPLATADLQQLRASDMSLTAALEDRVSTRDFASAAPITARQLGELLYRTARTRSVKVSGDQELPSRPYPSGGALYELELYPVVRTASGLDAGMYHYDSFDHVLRPVAAVEHPAVQRLLHPAALTLTNGQLPQLVIVVAARMERIGWAYEQMPYAVVLKHTGILTQSLYLTATAMGLGAVAQGYSDTAAFASATGADELAECAVGSIVVGTPAATA